jgi:hypothetical protein
VLALPWAVAACQYQEENMPGEGDIPFELYATAGDTRTANDGLQTKWVDGDRLTVIHAPAGSSAYVADGVFTIDEPSTGHAAGTVSNLVTDGASDWYLAYPYKATNTRPNKLTLSIGNDFGASQQQQGYDATSHLSGEAFPLWGKGRVTTAGGTIPSVSMHPLSSAIGVRVTNAGPGVVTLKSVSFTAPVPLVGQFSVDITGNEPVCTFLATSKTATLNVTDGTALAVGQTAVLYLGICPFSAAAGESLTLEVKASDSNNQDAVTTKTIDLTQAVTFTSGHIKYLNLEFGGEEEDPLLSISTPGVYQLDGKDYVYTPGTDQMSWRSGISQVAFRILTPSIKTAVEISGFPKSPQEGDSVSLTLSFYEGNNLADKQVLTFSLLRVQDGMAWCKSENGVGIILYYK